MNTTPPLESVNQPPALEGRTDVRRSGWTRRRWLVALLVAILGTIAGVALYETPAQKDFRVALQHLASISAGEGETGTPATATIEVLKGQGLPKALASLKLDVAIAAPDHLWVSGKINKEEIEVGRNGQQLWVWEPGKSFGVVGEPGVPKFSSAPETSRDTTILGPLTLRIPPIAPRLLPRLCTVQALEPGVLDGDRCRIVRVGAGRILRSLLELPQASATVWIRESDGWPVQVGFSDGKNVEALVAFSKLRAGAPIPESRWHMPSQAGATVERVAVSHLLNLWEVAPKLANTRLPTLGPADGSRKLVATHGKGHLEMRDGTRVLFLRGTPEEMGEQHGTLMKAQVRDLVQRVLYGVGVGSSFEKGRWFFGEIERCQARLAPFIDPRQLREMDAIAHAAGLEKEEIRLANFFPELFHCSGFAMMGDATAGKRIFHGRILDYMKGIGLEANAVVTVNQPDDGNAWVNIGYAGFTGSVTAMNAKHISIGEMGGRGEGNWDGKPMAQLVSEVMEKAGTLDEAIEIMRSSPRTCEYFYVIADGNAGSAVGIAATPETFDVVRPGEAHPRLPTPVHDAVLLSAGDRYNELVRRVQAGFGKFDADSARELMTRPVCMNSNIHSVLFAPDTLDFWVANADGTNVASHTRYTHYNLAELLK